MSHPSIAVSCFVRRIDLLPAGHLQLSCLVAALVGCWLMMGQEALAVPGRLSSYATAAVGIETRLTSVTIDDARGTIPVDQLIDIDLVHYKPASGSGTVTSILSPIDNDNKVSILVNERAKLLDSDVALNSGIVNVPIGSGLSAGSIYNPETTVGLAITFLQPVINGPGDDFVFFDFGSGTNPSADPFIASAIVNGHSTGFATVTSANYLASQTVLTTYTYSQTQPVISLTDLETLSLNNTSLLTTMSPRAAGGTFDFSNLGVPANVLVSGLFLTSLTSNTSFDPVFIAGLPLVAVPEPGTSLLVISAGLVALRLRAQRQRRISSHRPL